MFIHCWLGFKQIFCHCCRHNVYGICIHQCRQKLKHAAQAHLRKSTKFTFVPTIQKKRPKCFAPTAARFSAFLVHCAHHVEMIGELLAPSVSGSTGRREEDANFYDRYRLKRLQSVGLKNWRIIKSREQKRLKTNIWWIRIKTQATVQRNGFKDIWRGKNRNKRRQCALWSHLWCAGTCFSQFNCWTRKVTGTSVKFTKNAREPEMLGRVKATTSREKK